MRFVAGSFYYTVCYTVTVTDPWVISIGLENPGQIETCKKVLKSLVMANIFRIWFFIGSIIEKHTV